MKRLVVLALMTILLAGMSGVAFADDTSGDSINLGMPTITPSGSNFLYQYPVSIDNKEFINTAVNQSWVTLYDVNGLVPGSAAYTNNVGTLTDVVSVQNTGITPGTQVPVDDPTVPNITVTYTGTAPSTTALGTLSFLDGINGSDLVNHNYSAQATLIASGLPSANTSSVPVPAPEPGTLALMLSGALGMVGMIRRRIRH